MIKKSPPYPIEDERILTRAPKLAEDYEKAVRTSDPEVYVLHKPVAPPVEKFRPLEDLLAPEKAPSWSAVLQLIAMFALGLIAAGGILLALYNCVAHP